MTERSRFLLTLSALVILYMFCEWASDTIFAGPEP